MYRSQLYLLKSSDNKYDNKFMNEKDIITIGRNIPQPAIYMGFHSFLHRTKSAMSITKDLETKNKFYYIVNPFEEKIDDYTDDIYNTSLKYFNIKDEPTILTRAFYKLWEILCIFKIADNENMTFATVAEGPGGFIQAILQYRNKFGYNVDKDKIFSITIHPEKGENIMMNKNFMGYYQKKLPKTLYQFKTFSKTTANKYTGKSNGDITEIKTIDLFQKEIESKSKGVDMVTADGGFLWNDENYQEQEAYKLILGEIITALKVLNKNGSFVLKIFECFTITTNKLLYILGLFFDTLYIYKPYFSRDSNSERYVVCKGFLYDFKSKELTNYINILEKVLKSMDTNLFVIDIFPQFELPGEFLNQIKYININIMNQQQIMINKIITYIKGNNYFGEAYHEYKDNAIAAAKWWTSLFFTTKRDNNMMQEKAEYNMKEYELFKKKLL